MKNYAGKQKKVHLKRTIMHDNGRSTYEMACYIQNKTYCYAWTYNINEVTCKKCLEKIGVKNEIKIG